MSLDVQCKRRDINKFSRDISKVLGSVSFAVARICLLVFLAVLLALVLLLPATSYSQDTPQDPGEGENKKRLLLLPFPFYNDTIGPGVGVTAIAEGYIQRQTKTVGAALGSSEGTVYFFLKSKNIQVPWAKRIFLEPTLFYGKVSAVDLYLDGNPAFPKEVAGTNDSDADNFIEAAGTDQSYELRIKYLLPIGHGKRHIIPQIRLDDGILVSGQTGGDAWNPLKSGRTYIELSPFFREQNLEDENSSSTFLQRTGGVEVALTYDNTDHPGNPSKGSYQSVSFTRDWGGFNSKTSWSSLTFDLQKYFSLGATDNARQRVIALNVWGAHSLTWGNHKPPSYKSANLGGLWRLRGYPASRFHDRSAIYYGAEYRHIPKWNPLQNFTLGGRLDVDWIQFVGFAELGRVAPEWDWDTLHSDMQWSAGAGVRTMLNHLIVRIDYALSSETSLAQLFIGHPF